jgi:excinuclease ABC subunit A
MDTIRILDAHEHNLKHVSLDLPRHQLVVLTGVSGSGKSSLAFDTLYAEGQRRYIESMSAYARQFLGKFEKPKVEHIEGLSPTIAIDQKSVSSGPRSTVGTITEIYDALRVLFARVGVPHCPVTGVRIKPHTQPEILVQLNALPVGSKLQVLSPVVRGRKGDYNHLFLELRKAGFVRARIDGEMVILDELPADFRLAKTKIHDIEVVIDRVVLKDDDLIRARLAKAIETAMKKSDGYVTVQSLDSADGDTQEWFFSKYLASPHPDVPVEEMAPRLFSFNSPYGACPTCQGLGSLPIFQANLLVTEHHASLAQGAIGPLKKYLGKLYPSFIKAFGQAYGIHIETPFRELPANHQQFVLTGQPAIQRQGTAPAKSPKRRLAPSAEDFWADEADLLDHFDGVMAVMARKLEAALEGQNPIQREYLESFQVKQLCPSCQGARLKPFSLAVTLAGLNIAEICQMTISQANTFFQSVSAHLNDDERTIARQPLQAIEHRLSFLLNVGLDYLTLDRPGATLSGGEAQRIRLASQIGIGLSGVLYVLDEPSIGLHQHNNRQLIDTLQQLRDQGNSLIVVEHDEETIRAADWVVDIGPFAGRHGGHVVAQGHVNDIQAVPQSLTGDYLAGRRQIAIPTTPRQGTGATLTLEGASLHNLKDITVQFPLGTLTAVTGMSGSGKSTLVFDLLDKAVRFHLGQHPVPADGLAHIRGLEHIDKCIHIAQSPIGKSSRSNPATYVGVFDAIRNVFASTEAAKVRGYQANRFSFNVKGGRCEHCKGDGQISVEMTFLPEAKTTCEHCQGRRYNAETLSVTYNGATIADVLEMSVEDALALFAHQSSITRVLSVLADIGLGYLHLGQAASTLSGGEAQRLKLATEFCKRSTGQTLYLMDEPTVGLHWHDLDNLLRILNRLVDQGNTVIVVEHNLDLIKACDHVIDLGPEGGERGGEVLFAGTPQALAACPYSLTGQYLAPLLTAQAAPTPKDKNKRTSAKAKAPKKVLAPR